MYADVSLNNIKENVFLTNIKIPYFSIVWWLSANLIYLLLKKTTSSTKSKRVEIKLHIHTDQTNALIKTDSLRLQHTRSALEQRLESQRSTRACTLCTVIKVSRNLTRMYNPWWQLAVLKQHYNVYIQLIVKFWLRFKPKSVTISTLLSW